MHGDGARDDYRVVGGGAEGGKARQGGRLQEWDEKGTDAGEGVGEGRGERKGAPGQAGTQVSKVRQGVLS